MIELTEEQRQAIAGETAPTVIDPQTKESYVLVRQEAYERLKSLLSLDDYDPDEGATLINEIMAEDDVHDPLLESYQHHRRRE